VTTFKSGWAKLLAVASITNLRRHDLRRTQATWQGSAGIPLQITSKTLGHKTLMMTSDHYAMANDGAKRDALTRTNLLLMAAANAGGTNGKENQNG
jgi:integrase